MGLLLSKQEIEIAIPDRPSGIDRTVEKIAAAVIVVGLAPAGIGKHFVSLLHRPKAL